MRSTSRHRLSVRMGTAPVPALVEGMPPSLEPALRSWIQETAALKPDEAHHAMVRLDLVLPQADWDRYERELRKCEREQARLDARWEAEQVTRTESTRASRGPVVPLPPDPYVLFLAWGTEREVLWDVVDDLLCLLCTELPAPEKPPFVTWFSGSVRRTKRIVEPLDRLLVESRSVYEVTPNQRGLQRRMEAGLSEALNVAANAAESSGYLSARQYLERARDKLMAVHTDPSGAYVDVIRAVEAVACPMLLPRDQLPTLGKVRDHLRNADAKYEYVLTNKSGKPGNTGGVVAMLTDLWEGHSDRHAGGPREVPVSQEAAEAALTTATALVTLLSMRAVRPRTNAAAQRREAR
ncbi:hypothetical protein OG204_10145 [Streptomyces sp. NBC_01387]|uniref:hypothetical protein n=1 Tax=unclassified Streptomyces TaxID=2593676 RepID=UPI00202500B6|nr:hypothetical protein [Streptomyces sp. A 4/2]